MLGRKLGKGNYAYVEEAIQLDLDAHVAIKVIDTSRVRDAYVLRNLHREAAVLRRLHHPHIVAIFAALRSADLYCIVTELIGGGELSTFVSRQRGGRLDERTTLIFGSQLISALAHMHDAGVVHRDIKMKNILLTRSCDAVKIIDFGLSNTWSPNKPLKTHCGSPGYAAPEIYVYGKTYGPEVDLWSLGVVLFVMAVGRLPFPSVKDANMTPQERRRRLMLQINRGATEAHAKALGHFSPAFRDVVQGLLTANVSRRMSLRQLLEHPWVANRLRTRRLLGQPYRLTGREHALVLSKLAILLNMPVQAIEAHSRSDKLGEVAAMYNILAQKQLATYHASWSQRKLRSQEGMDQLDRRRTPPAATGPGWMLHPRFRPDTGPNTWVPASRRASQHVAKREGHHVPSQTNIVSGAATASDASNTSLASWITSQSSVGSPGGSPGERRPHALRPGPELEGSVGPGPGPGPLRGQGASARSRDEVSISLTGDSNGSTEEIFCSAASPVLLEGEGGEGAGLGRLGGEPSASASASSCPSPSDTNAAPTPTPTHSPNPADLGNESKQTSRDRAGGAIAKKANATETASAANAGDVTESKSQRDAGRRGSAAVAAARAAAGTRDHDRDHDREAAGPGPGPSHKFEAAADSSRTRTDDYIQEPTIIVSTGLISNSSSPKSALASLTGLPQKTQKSVSFSVIKQISRAIIDASTKQRHTSVQVGLGNIFTNTVLKPGLANINKVLSEPITALLVPLAHLTENRQTVLIDTVLNNHVNDSTITQAELSTTPSTNSPRKMNECKELTADVTQEDTQKASEVPRENPQYGQTSFVLHQSTTPDPDNLATNLAKTVPILRRISPEPKKSLYEPRRSIIRSPRALYKQFKYRRLMISHQDSDMPDNLTRENEGTANAEANAESPSTKTDAATADQMFPISSKISLTTPPPTYKEQNQPKIDSSLLTENVKDESTSTKSLGEMLQCPIPMFQSAPALLPCKERIRNKSNDSLKNIHSPDHGVTIKARSKAQVIDDRDKMKQWLQKKSSHLLYHRSSRTCPRVQLQVLTEHFKSKTLKHKENKSKNSEQAKEQQKIEETKRNQHNPKPRLKIRRRNRGQDFQKIYHNKYKIDLALLMTVDRSRQLMLPFVSSEWNIHVPRTKHSIKYQKLDSSRSFTSQSTVKSAEQTAPPCTVTSRSDVKDQSRSISVNRRVEFASDTKDNSSELSIETSISAHSSSSLVRNESKPFLE